MKRKASSKKKAFKVPGNFLMKQVKNGMPKIDGVYACYFQSDIPNGWSKTNPCVDMKLINFAKGKFYGNVSVLAWIGPLPVLSLNKLTKNNKTVNRVFCIGTAEGATNHSFKQGPFSQYMFAYLAQGDDGDFIFEITSENTMIKIAKFNSTEMKWVKLKRGRNASTKKHRTRE